MQRNAAQKTASQDQGTLALTLDTCYMDITCYVDTC